jgi:hypothetical protein
MAVAGQKALHAITAAAKCVAICLLIFIISISLVRRHVSAGCSQLLAFNQTCIAATGENALASRNNARDLVGLMNAQPLYRAEYTLLAFSPTKKPKMCGNWAGDVTVFAKMAPAGPLIAQT